ncbi:carboxylesterase family protein [Mariannaea sp. PMI_226]|nr:carboxylesterase family protein [Mariannaea sp. PMI_226]
MKGIVISLLAQAACITALSELPRLKLPWGTWEATVYEKDQKDPEVPKVYLFQNVRFGAKPERFSAPSFPADRNDTLQNITSSTSCIQVDITKLKKPPGGQNPLGDAEDPDIKETEDCLFLDIYVPVSAFQRDAKPLPVVVWIYGGGYAFGSKNQAGPLYTAQSLLRASDYQTIFIAGNYRVGAFGWLASAYMQDVGQPNAGLYDQALMLDWVQEYISQVNGDKHQVSAWGESAGAGSILHHLIREDGVKPPAFTRFVAQSPAFEWAWDNHPNGKLDSMYKKFSELAGCNATYNISCLRSADIRDLTKANQQLFKVVRQTGLFPVGPAVDGKWIKTIPTVAFSQGKATKNITSAIISHCANEPKLFMPPVSNKADLEKFLKEFLPGDSRDPQRDKIKKQYCGGFWPDYKACTAKMIRDASFTCNTRDLFEAYASKSYMMEYSFPTEGFAYHATDLIALFANSRDEVKTMLAKTLGNVTAGIYADVLNFNVRKNYQQYFASFAISGNPNTLQPTLPRHWSIATGGEVLSNVMKVTGVFSNETRDDQNTKTSCDFWIGIAKEILDSSKTESGEEGSLHVQLPGDYNEL